MSTYKTSSVRLYYTSTTSRWELLPQKLFIIDSIEEYLADKSYLALSTIQYQKNALEIELVLDLSQTYAEPLNTSIKYVRIENSDQLGQYYYYYVKKVEWRSKSAVKLYLIMDVLNTFKEGTHYTFKPNTRVIREHKDRFILHEDTSIITLTCEVLNEDWYPDVNDEPTIETYPEGVEIAQAQVLEADTQTSIWVLKLNVFRGDISGLQRGDKINIISENNENAVVEIDTIVALKEYFRKIDYVNENINPVLQCGNSNGVKIQNNKTLLQDDWYLLYRNVNDPSESQVNPVDCFLLAKNTKAISTGVITSGQITPASLELGVLYYIPLHVVGSSTADLNALAYNQTITLSNGITLGETTDVNDFTYVVLAKTTDGKIEVSYNNLQYIPADDNFVLTGQTIYGMLSYITINQSPTYYSKSNVVGLDLHTLFETNLNAVNRQTFTYTSTGETLSAISTLDRTDPKNIKLIKLPYCPYDFTITSDKIDITASNWNYTDLTQANGTHLKVLQLNDLNTDLRSTFNFSDSSNNPVMNLQPTMTSPSQTDLRKGSFYESKLFHSEFYRPSYTYDSFSFVVPLEKLDVDSYVYSQNLTVYFDMTKTINSRFMFTFSNLNYKYSTESYAKYLIVARNNEEVLYNVPYINYIRTGFNYDVKAKNLSNASNWIGAGLSLTGVALSLALPSAPLKVLGVASSLLSMAMTTKNAITSTIQNEQSLERKLAEVKNQTASVSGADDVDLMSIYAENRLKYFVYQPNPIMKEMLYDLFFYAGYNSNRLGIPNHNTRINFDYLEADIDIENIANIPDECLVELVNSFKNGVSYIHKTSRTTDKWDIKQVYENWERTLL